MSAVRPPSRMAAAARLGLVAVLALAPPPGGGAPLGTAFTYQGQLTESGQPPTGLYDLQVCLFDGPSTPLPLACAPDFDDVPVHAGLFALTLDFGAAPSNTLRPMFEAMTTERRELLKANVRRRLRAGDGPLTVGAHANAVRGIKP